MSVAGYGTDGSYYGNKDVLNSVTSPRSTSSSSVFCTTPREKIEQGDPRTLRKEFTVECVYADLFAVLQVPQFPSFAEPPPADLLQEPTATNGPVPVSADSNSG